jgi:hypothetical protein
LKRAQRAQIEQAGEVPALRVNGWPGADYTRVIGYSFSHQGEPTSLMRDGKLRQDRLQEWKTKEMPLNAEQVKRLVNATFASKIRSAPAACYSPHLIYVFYDRNLEPVAAIEICFSCDNLNFTPYKDVGYHHDLAALARLSAELGIAFDSSGMPLDRYLQRLKEKSKASRK